ncbi:MAG: hypothetical protein P8Y45_08540 [Exilibacterium sp.]
MNKAYNLISSVNNSLSKGMARIAGESDNTTSDGRLDSDLDGWNTAPDRLNPSWNRNGSDRPATRLQVNHLLNF